MANLTLTIGGRPLKIQCSDNNIERVKEIGETISGLICYPPMWVALVQNQKKE